MIARISTIMRTNEDRMWQELQKVSSLMHVASPILKFRPQKGQSLPDKWILGMEYKLRISSFGIIPLGNHFIRLVELNKEEKRIISNEHGMLTRAWNHTITLNAIDDQTIKYTDKIEIKAGILTFSIWLFAHVFYRHRQRKWKKLLDS
jgi:hypothetical protein